MHDDGVRCALRVIEFVVAGDPGTCPGLWGHGYTLDSANAMQVGCGDLGIVNAASTVPGYGESLQSGVMSCSVSESGVTCWSTVNGKGFAIARAGASATS
jgi:hypothetical protein